MSIAAEQIADVLGGRRTLDRRVKSMRELDDIVWQGMPKPALDTFINALGTSKHGEFAIQLRNKIVPRATYNRVDRFNLQVSETTERMARLYAMALSVFDNAETAARFMSSPHPELQDRAPFEAALTEIGGREVKEVIERGLHGLPA